MADFFSSGNGSAGDIKKNLDHEGYSPTSEHAPEPLTTPGGSSQYYPSSPSSPNSAYPPSSGHANNGGGGPTLGHSQQSSFSSVTTNATAVPSSEFSSLISTPQAFQQNSQLPHVRNNSSGTIQTTASNSSLLNNGANGTSSNKQRTFSSDSTSPAQFMSSSQAGTGVGLGGQQPRTSIDERRGTFEERRRGHSRDLNNSGGYSFNKASSPGVEDQTGGLGILNQQTGFDEAVLRQLCELDCSLPLLGDRIKQSLSSAKNVSNFFSQRAAIEEKYARDLSAQCREALNSYQRSDGKAGSFVQAFQQTVKTHEQIAQGRLRFASRMNEIANDINTMSKEVEKLRKEHKETGARYERNVEDAQATMDKAKSKFDTTVDELERLLIMKEGENMKESNMHPKSSPALQGNVGSSGGSSAGGKKVLGKAMTKGAGLFKGKGAASMQRQEEDVRQRMAATSDHFRKSVLDAQSVRQEYFNSQLPKILRSLKQALDDCDLGTQYHLGRYAFLYESTMLGEGIFISPLDPADTTTGLKTISSSIDNRSDFKQYMQNYIVARGGVPRGPRRDGPYDDNYVPPLPPHVLQSQQQQQYQASLADGTASNQQNGAVPNHKAVFGVDLTDLMMRDGDEVPKILEVCTKAIEERGLQSMGIYRLSGTTSVVQKLKGVLDKDVDSVDLMNDEQFGDINVVASTLKLWFRELPEPLFTFGLYDNFIEAAKTENDRLRHIRMHEQVNELPDANYAALKFFMCHLYKIRSQESINQMSASNLSIVFGPTLFRSPPTDADPSGLGAGTLSNMSFECKAVETILLKYEEIFV